MLSYGVGIISDMITSLHVYDGTVTVCVRGGVIKYASVLSSVVNSIRSPTRAHAPHGCAATYSPLIIMLPSLQTSMLLTTTRRRLIKIEIGGTLCYMSIILGRNSEGRYCVATVTMAERAAVYVDNVPYSTVCSWTVPFPQDCRGIITAILRKCGVGGTVAGHFLANIPPENVELVKATVGQLAAALSLAQIGGKVAPTSEQTDYTAIKKVSLGSNWTISVSPTSKPVTITQ